jgi:hypothetical protein
VAPFHLALVLDAVAQLHLQLTTALGHADVLVANSEPAADEFRGMRRSLEDATALVHRLAWCVMSDAVIEIESHRETTLRDRAAAVVMQLAELRLAEPEMRGHGNELFPGRFHGLADVTVYVLSRITEINEARIRARLAAESSTDGLDIGHVPRADAYKLALDRIERGFAKIGHDADLQCFLQHGARVRSTSLRIACRTIAILLDVPIHHASREERAS